MFKVIITNATTGIELMNQTFPSRGDAMTFAAAYVSVNPGTSYELLPA
jgi:hypothetical protein